MVAIPPQNPKTAYDWDSALLSLQWIGVDWRPLLTPAVVSSLPWEQLQTSTVEQLALMHDDYDRHNNMYPKDDKTWFRISPAIEELARRDIRDMTRRLQILGNEAQDARDWVQDRDRFEDVRFRQPVASPEDDWVRSEAVTKDPYFTVGFELELPVAVYRRTRCGIPDPHPNETRWLADISDKEGEPDLAHVRQVVVDRMLEVLNAQTDMVFTPMDPSEPAAGVETAAEALVNDALMGFADADAEKCAQGALKLALEMYFNPEAGGKRLAVATEEDILNAINHTPLLGLPGKCDPAKTRERFGILLRLRISQAQRDPRGITLPHMKPRYRAFSVYAMPPYTFRGADGIDYADRLDYNGRLQQKFDPYHWEVIKISSPVLRVEVQKTLDVLRQICRVVRNNFRVHRDMPSVPVTTQISVSNRAGFDLIDLKRFVSLLVILRERGFNQLNRAHRSSRVYDHVCGDIRRVSQLGGLTDMEYFAIEQADDWVMPQPPADERAEKLWEMERNLPKDLIPALQGKGKLSDRIFFAALWSYATITDMARALSTPLFSRKAEVMVKVTGDGTKSNFIDPQWTGRDSGEGLFFDPVDSHRGVLEFRQCGGSLDPHHILCWLATCCCVVNSAKFTDEKTFKRLLTRIITSDESPLEALKINPEIQKFYQDQFNAQVGFFEPAGSEVNWSDPFYPRRLNIM
ncbi:hypothetical protein F4805DRAFT_461118 [Annulohypoxylon moriforme]|nr:hypothetical protein F4805DRAFT_461118 [Annulohypoxylon moriforme]